MKAIQYGNLEDNIRVNFWVMQAPFFDLENELQRKLDIGSVFVNVFEEIQKRLKDKPLDRKMHHQILVDLQRTRSP
jgi:hypothetical protein